MRYLLTKAWFLLFLPFVASIVASAAFAVNMPMVRGSVFKIEVVSQTPRFTRPWLQNSSSSSTGSGFYIGNNHILTNAHVVANGKFITVQRDGDDRPVEVRVAFIAHDCDLALLEPVDKTYLSRSRPLTFGGIPKLHRAVATVGYPRGGEQISITEGVVSRISYRRYAHTAFHDHLLVQVDSAINPGNSGGPVLQGDKVVGVAFQSYINAENTGYIIPVPIIERFLKDVKDGRYDGHPVDGLIVMSSALENEATSRFHKLENKGGVKVVHVDTFSPLFNVIQPGDVLLEIGGRAIGADGKIRYQDERVHFNVLYDLLQVGDSIDVKLVRGQKLINERVKITKTKPHYIRAHQFPSYPKYVVFAGLVFTNLSRDYLRAMRSGKKNWYQQTPLLLRYLHWYSQMEDTFKDSEDIVVFATRLPHPINAYADDFDNKVLTAINGQPIQSMSDIIRIIEDSKDEFLVFDFYGPEAPLVIPREKALAAHKEILSQYDVSPDKWLKNANESDGALGGI